MIGRVKGKMFPEHCPWKTAPLHLLLRGRSAHLQVVFVDFKGKGEGEGSRGSIEGGGKLSEQLVLSHYMHHHQWAYIWKSGFGPNGSREEKSKTVLPVSMRFGSYRGARDGAGSPASSHPGPCSSFC